MPESARPGQRSAVVIAAEVVVLIAAPVIASPPSPKIFAEISCVPTAAGLTWLRSGNYPGGKKRKAEI